MKILKVNLIAFGPFTETVLDLSEGEEGLHIIYGPNEAGKSSALRALRQMLYGIPDRSADDFLHPYAKMQIGGVIRHSDGTMLDFVRRKGRGNTLRTGDDNKVLDEAQLRRFLGNIDASIFATMFGIGHADLVQGGEEITQGGGNVGQALFAAGSGLSDLRRIQMELQADAEALFKPTATTKPINVALADLKKNLKEIRDAQLPGQEWEVHYRALQEAQNRKNEVDHDLQAKERIRHRLERIRDSLPLIVRRNELLVDLESHTDAVFLPDGFGERRSVLITDFKVAENTRDQAQKSIKEIEKVLGKMETSHSLLDNAEFIEDLHKELGSYQKAAKDRPQLVTRRDVLWSEAREILAGLRDDLTIDEAEKLRLKKTESVKIQDLSTRYERLMTKLEGARGEVRKLSLQIGKLEKQVDQLEATQPVPEFKAAIERAMKYGALEDHCSAEYADIRAGQASLEAALSKQILWAGNLETLESLPMASMETINTFEERLDEAQRVVSQLQAERNNLDKTLLEIEGQIEELRLEREVPTEKDLQEARQMRDQGWQLVLCILEGNPEIDGKVGEFIRAYPPSKTLKEAYEQSVSKADEIADRLRREADRVAKKAKLLSDREIRRSQSQLLKEQIEEAKEKLGKNQKAWAQVWESLPISPLSPREMRAWVQDLNSLAEKAARLRERMTRAEELKTQIASHRKGMEYYLLSISEPPLEEQESLSDVIRRCQKILNRQDEIRNKREQLVREKEQKEEALREAEIGVKQIEEELSDWEKEWEQAIRPLGLGKDAVPAQASAVIEDIKSLFDKLKESQSLQTRIKGIDTDTETFSRKVAGLTERVASDLKDIEIEQAVVELSSRLTRSRTERSKQQSLETQQNQKKEEFRKAELRIAEIGSKLERLCEEAGCSRYEDLPQAEKRSAKRLQIESELKELEEQLRKLSGGVPIEDFVKEAGEVDPDEIGSQMDRLCEEINMLDKEKSNFDQAIGRERNELTKMDGSARAADLAEETQRILARLESYVEQYARLRPASTVLSQAIERYREKHQGPILKITNELFAALTLGSFEGIRVEFNEQGTPVLIGVRPGGKETVGMGGMSDGTTDQLYLALRLASMETYLEENEPMPLIVDDILIKFDDERATAALKVLADLSGKTQVIFFTHHRHLVELAEANIDPSILLKHPLGP